MQPPEVTPIDGISRMNLVKGDVLILQPKTAAWFSSLPMEVLDEFVRAVGWQVPVIIDMDGGGVGKVSKADLVKLLENME